MYIQTQAIETIRQREREMLTAAYFIFYAVLLLLYSLCGGAQNYSTNSQYALIILINFNTKIVILKTVDATASIASACRRP